jgi:aminoacyl tRNA synthase complex-interacting multifunctional protein 1
MRGKVIVFANLKARPLGGFNSNGMVICASNQPQNQFDLLSPEGPLGERLYLDGFEELFQTGEEILPIIKKKTLDKCKQYFSTDAEGFVIWKGHKLRTKAGFVKSKITNGLVD